MLLQLFHMDDKRKLSLCMRVDILFYDDKGYLVPGLVLRMTKRYYLRKKVKGTGMVPGRRRGVGA